MKKPACSDAGACAKASEKATSTSRPVALTTAGEVEARPVADPLRREGHTVGLRVRRAQHQHGEALAALQELGDEAGEGKHGIVGRRRREALAEPDQFEKGAVELDDMVLGAPGMAVAVRHLEAEAPIAFGGGFKVVEGEDEMVEGAGHAAHAIREAGRKEPP